MTLCQHYLVPVVTQGGLTGLCAGAHPDAGELALSLERLTGVEEVDADGVMVVRAGTLLQVVQEVAAQHGWHCGIDIGSRGSCTIGGNVATNAGGNCVVRYGMTRDNVLGLEAVLADGRVLTSLNRMRKNNCGYDLKQLFIGSEGTLGVVTRVALQLHPEPLSQECAFIALRDYESAIALLRRGQKSLGGIVSSFEVMWPDYYSFVVDVAGAAAPLQARHAIYALLEVRGFDAVADRGRLENVLAEAFETGEVEDAVIAQSLDDVRRLWDVRDDVARWLDPYIPSRTTFDVSVPIRAMQLAVDQVRARILHRWENGTVLCFGHIGDGNVHIAVSLPDHRAHIDELNHIVFSQITELGGVISAEHGIGRKRRAYLRYSRSEAELEVMKLIKQNLDPNSILNPNKII
jgi:FAD/FMN-containing dehydrogenase